MGGRLGIVGFDLRSISTTGRYRPNLTFPYAGWVVLIGYH